MPVSNHDYVLVERGAPTVARPTPGADRFGLQIVPNEATESALVVLQGSINGTDWVDLATVTIKDPMVGAGGTAKSPVIRYLRVIARTLTGDGASVAVHVVAK